MMIDSSALVAIVLNEPEAGRLADAIAADATRLISAVNWVEAMVVAEARRGAAEDIRMVLADYGVSSVAFDERQSLHAYEAWLRFGKGRHRAGLNFGDCCAYGAAVSRGEPLLYKGDDFGKTDVDAVDW